MIGSQDEAAAVTQRHLITVYVANYNYRNDCNAYERNAR
jgi:hypothetical protein